MTTVNYEFSVNRYAPNFIRFTHPLAREALSEFLSTFLFLLCGVGGVIQWKTSNGEFNNWTANNINWGFAVMFGCGLGIAVSGGHMNPAVTLAQALLGRKTFLQVLMYLPAQILGAMAGTAMAYANYQAALNNFDGGHRVASGEKGSLCMLVTCPVDFEGHAQGVLDQTVATGILTLVMAAVIDKRNGVPIFLHPMFGGLSVIMIGMSYGMNCGYPINPARDFGARLFALCVYGGAAFSDHDYWFWVPIVGPTIGGAVGAWLYNIFVDVHTPALPYTQDNKRQPTMSSFGGAELISQTNNNNIKHNLHTDV